jgi:hypothetical protein
VLHLVEAAEEELAEAARLLDLAEDRLDGDLAQGNRVKPIMRR